MWGRTTDQVDRGPGRRASDHRDNTMLGLPPRPNPATKTWCAHQRIKVIRALPTDCQRDVWSRRCIRRAGIVVTVVNDGRRGRAYRSIGSSSDDVSKDPLTRTYGASARSTPPSFLGPTPAGSAHWPRVSHASSTCTPRVSPARQKAPMSTKA